MNVDSKDHSGLAERFARLTDSELKDVIVRKVFGWSLSKEGSPILYPPKLLATALIATTGLALYSLSRPVIPALAGIDAVHRLSTNAFKQVQQGFQYAANRSPNNPKLLNTLTSEKEKPLDGQERRAIYDALTAETYEPLNDKEKLSLINNS